MFRRVDDSANQLAELLRSEFVWQLDRRAAGKLQYWLSSGRGRMDNQRNKPVTASGASSGAVSRVRTRAMSALRRPGERASATPSS